MPRPCPCNCCNQQVLDALLRSQGSQDGGDYFLGGKYR